MGAKCCKNKVSDSVVVLKAGAFNTDDKPFTEGPDPDKKLSRNVS